LSHEFVEHYTSFLRRTIAAQLHLLGCFAALVGLLILQQCVLHKAHGFHIYACLIFGMTSIFVFGVSTIYHFMSDGFGISEKLEQRMEDLDHVSIFLFIAGTYTPFFFNAISEPLNQSLLWLIWSVAAAGIAYTLLRPKLPSWARHRFVNTGIFVLMGWIFLVYLGEAVAHMSAASFFNLIAGGVAYSVGAVIYATKRPNLFSGVFGFHELWHLMVLMGFGFHYFMVLDFYS